MVLPVAVACAVMVINPLFWNAVSRFEYRTRSVSKMCGGPKRGVTLLAMGILSLNCLRTYVFHAFVDSDSSLEPLLYDVPLEKARDGLAYVLYAAGTLLVVSSSYRLGFFCSFMGDYFGILLDEKVTGFPFNFCNNPMYWGSVMIYLGMTLQAASSVGLLLTAFIALSYWIAIKFEEPFTAAIYRQRQ